MKHHLLLVKDTFINVKKALYINKYELAEVDKRTDHKTRFFIETVYKRRIVNIYFDTVEELNTGWLEIQILIS